MNAKSILSVGEAETHKPEIDSWINYICGYSLLVLLKKGHNSLSNYLNIIHQKIKPNHFVHKNIFSKEKNES